MIIISSPTPTHSCDGDHHHINNHHYNIVQSLYNHIVLASNRTNMSSPTPSHVMIISIFNLQELITTCDVLKAFYEWHLHHLNMQRSLPKLSLVAAFGSSNKCWHSERKKASIDTFNRKLSHKRMDWFRVVIFTELSKLWCPLTSWQTTRRKPRTSCRYLYSNLWQS